MTIGENIIGDSLDESACLMTRFANSSSCSLSRRQTVSEEADGDVELTVESDMARFEVQRRGLSSELSSKRAATVERDVLSKKMALHFCDSYL